MSPMASSSVALGNPIDEARPLDPHEVAGCAAVGVTIRDLALIVHARVHSAQCGNAVELATVALCPVACHPGDWSLAVQGNTVPSGASDCGVASWQGCLLTCRFSLGPQAWMRRMACGSTISAAPDPCCMRQDTPG